MSKIFISLAQPNRSMEVVKIIRMNTGLAFGVINRLIAHGISGIFYDAELFLNDHVVRDKQIRTILSDFKKVKVELFVMHFSFHESLPSLDKFESARIDEETLVNILNRAKGRYE